MGTELAVKVDRLIDVVVSGERKSKMSDKTPSNLPPPTEVRVWPSDLSRPDGSSKFLRDCK